MTSCGDAGGSALPRQCGDGGGAAEPDPTTLSGILSASGDNMLVAGPPNGERIVVARVVLAVAGGRGDDGDCEARTTAERRINAGDAVSDGVVRLPFGKEIRLDDNAMLILNLSGDNQVYTWCAIGSEEIEWMTVGVTAPQSCAEFAKV